MSEDHPKLITRRQLLTAGLMAAGGLVANRLRTQAAYAPKAGRLNPATLQQFVEILPIPPIARPSAARTIAGGVRAPLYHLTMGEFLRRVHPELPPTRMWGYDGCSPGPTIEAHADEPLLIQWSNQLPLRHLFAVDQNLCGAEPGTPDVRAVVHLHGARVAAADDGYPEAWYVPGKAATYHYPNTQEAATLWYHDHAIGITRLNIFAGLFGAYVVRDRAEAALNLPHGPHEIPLLIYDRDLDQNGQLTYPVSPDPSAPWVSEFVGNAILVNGKLFPYLEVERRRYRLRIFNVSNGRTFHLTFAHGPPFHLIGVDQGLRATPLETNSLVVAPAERADVIVDFRDAPGERIVLRNDAQPLLQFRVGTVSVHDSSALPATLRSAPPPPESSAVRSRILTLDENDNATGNPQMMLLNGARWHDPVTEKPARGMVEIWSFVNRTEDVHPIHLHAVRFQLLDRRRFDPVAFQQSRTLRFVGPPATPDPAEAGWKDTIRAFPNMVTRIIVPFEGPAGRYVWHCHVLEHEDNEMMRPYEIVDHASNPRSFSPA